MSLTTDGGPNPRLVLLLEHGLAPSSVRAVVGSQEDSTQCNGVHYDSNET